MNLFDWVNNLFLKSRVSRYIKRWAKRTDAKGISDCVVVRTYEANDIYLDLYWRIKKSQNDKHVESIYQRCSWQRTKSMILDVERHQLPRVIERLKREGKI